jgi:hypothetical protein
MLSDSLVLDIRGVVERAAHREKSDAEFMECVKRWAEMEIYRALTAPVRNVKEEN